MTALFTCYFTHHPGPVLALGIEICVYLSTKMTFLPVVHITPSHLCKQEPNSPLAPV